MAIVAFDLGGSSFKFGLIANDELILKKNIPLVDTTSLHNVLPHLEKEINQCQQKGYAIEGIGMAFPTIVDNQSNRLLYQYVKYQDANDIDLNAWAKHHWNAPLALENDARAALLGERYFGSHGHSDHMVLVTLGTGMGSAAIVDGKLIRGAHFLAGNLGGHMSIAHNGETCNCGNIGCLESVASSWSLPQVIKKFEGFEESEYVDGNISYKRIFDQAEQGDSFSIRVRDYSLNAWYTGILNLIYAFDPEIIIMSGGIMKSAEVIIPFIQKKINQSAWLPKEAVLLKKAKYPEYAGVLGLSQLFK